MSRKPKTKLKEELAEELKVATPESGDTEPQGDVDPNPEDNRPEGSPKTYAVYRKGVDGEDVFVREYSSESSAINKRKAEEYAKKVGGTAKEK